MQNYITKEDLLSLGIALDNESIDSLIEHVNETVEERVGADIAASLSFEQLKELVTLQETATDEEIDEWISQQVTDREKIIQDTIDIVLGELAKDAETIK